MIRSWCLAALFLAAGSLASAQSIQLAPLENTQPPADIADDALVWLPSYHFHLNMAHLSSEKDRYNWDANYGGELGIVAYGQTQLTFVANYQAVLGEEFQPFDPTQGNYTVDGVLSTRVKGFYVAGVFHHLSRHLGDRPKEDPVDWNMMGGRIGAQFTRNGTDVEARFDLLKSVLKTNVDYEWEMHTGLRVHRNLHGTLGLIGGAQLRHIGTNERFSRANQTGGRGEAGFRVSGRAVTVELFLAVERVIDPYPTERGTETFASVGMRLLSR